MLRLVGYTQIDWQRVINHLATFKTAPAVTKHFAGQTVTPYRAWESVLQKHYLPSTRNPSGFQVVFCGTLGVVDESVLRSCGITLLQLEQDSDYWFLFGEFWQFVWVCERGPADLVQNLLTELDLVGREALRHIRVQNGKVILDPRS